MAMSPPASAFLDGRCSKHACTSEAKMDLVAPNLAALIGEIIGARLISHAGAAS